MEIAQHIAGAAQRALFTLDMEDGHWRFGRNPLDATINVVIEHEVADAKNLRLLQLFDQRNEVGSVHGVVLSR
jgi:hypothetical protein